MSSTLARNEEKKGSRPSQPTTPATSLGCNLVSRSEEFLTQISTELTDEALFVAAYHMNPVPIKEKQTQDRGTQISKHVFFTKTRGTDTRSDRNRTCTKAHLLPSPREKVCAGSKAIQNNHTVRVHMIYSPCFRNLGRK
ncbi:PREDICTED: putative protein T-ENOL isoform X2 [Capra hircus]|uniref:putative protein T-ENOL isoform X2 n=1 Tax=Capra hircus TaxID=9925 RepID=UPI00084777BE|nr:PREDICTED: putative protein T-ENOL isoform X2 [Capra hircus]